MLLYRYQERGFPFGYVTSYNGFESGDVEVSICEGKIGSIDVVYVDDSGNPVVGRNETPKDVVLRSSPFRVSPAFCSPAYLLLVKSYGFPVAICSPLCRGASQQAEADPFSSYSAGQHDLPGLRYLVRLALWTHKSA